MLGARPVRTITEFIATLCCGIFFGAAIYISIVQHPAALETGSEFAVRFFAPMYRRAATMQASLAIVGAIISIIVYLSGAGRNWLVTAVLIASVVPFTLLIIEPLNEQIKTLDPSADRSLELLTRWGSLHWVRTVASGAAFVICLLTILNSRFRSLTR